MAPTEHRAQGRGGTGRGRGGARRGRGGVKPGRGRALHGGGRGNLEQEGDIPLVEEEEAQHSHALSGSPSARLSPIPPSTSPSQSSEVQDITPSSVTPAYIAPTFMTPVFMTPAFRNPAPRNPAPRNPASRNPAPRIPAPRIPAPRNPSPMTPAIDETASAGRLIPGTSTTYQEAVITHTRDYLVAKGISVEEIINAELVRYVQVK